jgi:hypothetical protein
LVYVSISIHIYLSHSSEVAGFAGRGLVFEVAEALLAESKAALLAEPLMRCVPLEYSQSTHIPYCTLGVPFEYPRVPQKTPEHPSSLNYNTLEYREYPRLPL